MEVDRKTFEGLVADAIDSLPGYFRRRLENVAVVVEDEARGREDILGLYQGVPLSKRGQSYGSVPPDKITIFKKNIERHCSDENGIRDAVKRTVMHEFAHYFGISDEHMKKSGTY